jgi:hypothetical protein
MFSHSQHRTVYHKRKRRIAQTWQTWLTVRGITISRAQWEEKSDKRATYYEIAKRGHCVSQNASFIVAGVLELAWRERVPTKLALA